METTKKVAIIDKRDIRDVVPTEEFQSAGISLTTMLVNENTTPPEVAVFVSRENPDLVILAENYSGIAEVLRALEKKFYDVDTPPKGTLPPIKKGEGVEALAEIRKLNRNLPVYMLSSIPQYEEKAMAAGATGYVNSVASPTTLKGILEKHYAGGAPSLDKPGKGV